MTRQKPLGRGLSALFSESGLQYAGAEATTAAPPGTTITRVAPSQLRPAAAQPRRRFDEAALDDLTQSIRAHGVLQPLLVRPLMGEVEQYEIIAGERRWRAARAAEIAEVPVIVRELSDAQALELALIENLQRQDLTPLEEAEGFRRLMADFAYTQETVARMIGKSRSHVSNMIRLLSLPDPVRALLDEGRLSAGHARALLGAPDPVLLAHRVVRDQLSVRDTEALVAGRQPVVPDRPVQGGAGLRPSARAAPPEAAGGLEPGDRSPPDGRWGHGDARGAGGPAATEPGPPAGHPGARPPPPGLFAAPAPGAPKDPEIIAMEGAISEFLRMRVVISPRGEHGTITIHYADLGQLDDLLQRLSGEG